MIIVFWIALSAIVGVAANTRGRVGWQWGVLALFITPLLAGLLLFALPRLDPIAAQAQRATPLRRYEQQQGPQQPDSVIKFILFAVLLAFLSFCFVIGFVKSPRTAELKPSAVYIVPRP